MKHVLVVPAILVIIGTILVAGWVPSGYYILQPGGAYDVESRLHIPAEYREESGHLAFTAVRAGPGRWLDVALAWIDPVSRVVPGNDVRPEGISQEEFNEINQELIDESKSVAAVVALRRAGFDARVTGQGAMVQGLLEDMPAADVLKQGDVIVGVDGEPVQTAVQVIEVTRRHQVGDDVQLEIERDGARHTVTVGTTSSPEEPNRPVIGAAISTYQYDVVLPFSVTIDTEGIGGPSAGTMFALGILDAVTDGTLTRGHFVAGTGTISADGTVGPIDGATQKVVAAERDGADVFLAPRQNYEEASHAAHSIRVVPVDRFEDALQSLCGLDPINGASPEPPPPCDDAPAASAASPSASGG